MPLFETSSFGEGGGGQGELVVYVDDDEVMSLLAEQLLERKGFVVETFSSGSAALSWAADHGAMFCLLVTDYNMLDMTGGDLARRLRKIYPHLPMIITWGNVTDDIRHQAAAIGLCEVLEKQLTLEQLPFLVGTALKAPG